MTDLTVKQVRRRAVPKPVVAPVAAPVIDFPSAADPAVSVSEDQIMATTFEQTTDTLKDTATTGAAALADRAKGAMEKGKHVAEEMGAFTKGNVEAIVESTGIYARGLESFGHDAAAFAKKSYEDATATMKALTAVKSPTEFFKLQSDYTRSIFDAMVAETSKSTEKMVKLAGEVAQPISNRVSLAAEKVKLAA